MTYRALSCLFLSLLLTGCVGTVISGNTGNLDQDYPDIRSVPGREEATESRGIHEGDEKEASELDYEKLDQDREALKARNEALRKEAFSESEE